ncbi:MAG: methyltransferase domain-containing protein [Alphaproteobacteria bacterium]|nr:methyltransferase domain-containing protein [Alphaproteobacteria bacterium]
MNRRSLMQSMSTLASALGFSATNDAKAARATRSGFAGDVDPRGTTGILERLPSLDLESRQNFLTSFRGFSQRDLSRAARNRIDVLFRERGLDPQSDPSIKQVLSVVGDDPLVALSVHTWLRCQQMTWSSLADEFHGKADAYFAEMEATDKSGPGTLELNPDMVIPDYAKHEIHVQPGGYVGDPFAGHIYHYGTNNFYVGRNDQDEILSGFAQAVPPPADGKVTRILDLGCSIGQLTVALKRRYPDAEVWGIDVGGPLVRYGHMRAVDLGVDVNLAQRLAEDTKFPDRHFDIVTSYILFHELPADISRRVVQEAYRVLRPGGVFFPIDFYTGSVPPTKSAAQKLRHWWDHRWNNEVWWYEYSNLDLPSAMRDAGFAVDENGPRAWIGSSNLLGTKPA